MNKLEIAVAALLDTWTTRASHAHACDAMLMNKQTRELREALAAIQSQPDVAVEKEKQFYAALSANAAKNKLEFAMRDALAEQLRGLYHCGRVWSAWGVGTMSEDDFSPAEEDDDIIENFVSAAMAAIQAQGSDAA